MDFAIIAAGEGSRLVQEGYTLPKPLVHLQGIPIIERLISIFIQNHASSINIIINRRSEEVIKHLRTLKLPVKLTIIQKNTESSLHSFYELLPFFTGDKMCLTTVDTVFNEDEFSKFITAFEQDDKSDGYMAVTSFVDDEKPLFVQTDDRMQITGFLDQNDGSCRFVSGGVYALRTSTLTTVCEAIDSGIARMRNFQRKLIDNHYTLQAFPFSKIVDIDHIQDIAIAEEMLLKEGKTNY